MTSAANVVCMGESIGEVVQSSDAGWSTQIFTYITWVTFFSGDNPTVPTVALNFFGVVGNPNGRPRPSPNHLNKNISVSGDALSDLLYARAKVLTEAQIEDADYTLLADSLAVQAASHSTTAEANQLFPGLWEPLASQYPERVHPVHDGRRVPALLD